MVQKKVQCLIVLNFMSLTCFIPSLDLAVSYLRVLSLFSHALVRMCMHFVCMCVYFEIVRVFNLCVCACVVMLSYRGIIPRAYVSEKLARAIHDTLKPYPNGIAIEKFPRKYKVCDIIKWVL